MFFFWNSLLTPAIPPQTQYPGSPIPSMSRPNLAGIQHPPDPKITKKSSLRIYWSNENLTFYQLPNCIDPHHFSKSKSVFFPSKGIWISFNLLDPSPKFVTTNSLFDWVNSLTILFGCSGLFGGSGCTSICGTSWVVGSNGWSLDDPAKVNIGSMGSKRCWKMLEGIFFCMAHFVSSVFDCG